MTKKNNKICLFCGKGFYVQPYRFDEAKYCSIKCFDEKIRSKHIFNCKNCGKEQIAFGYTKGRKKYCSKKCMEEFRHTPLEELVKRGYEKRDSGCWEWVKDKVTTTGYGKLTYKGKTMSAHRASYIVHKGEIPKGKHICHTCDNRACVNPDHLWVGTQKENIQDMIAKGRKPCQKGRKLSPEHFEKLQFGRKNNHPGKQGSKHHLAKLTEEKVKEIKKLISQGYKNKEIAELYKVDQSNISHIRSGKRWSHVSI